MLPSASTPEERREKEVLWIFDAALILKAVNGAIEVFIALGALFIPPQLVLWFIDFGTAGELAQDTNDPVASLLRESALAFSVSNHTLVAAYLILHGGIKVLLVIGIFAGKRIAYPLFMIGLTVFGAYEAYRGVVRQEMLLQVLAVLDFLLLALTAYEYRRRYPGALSLGGLRGGSDDL